MYLLGLDIGSSSVKVALIDAETGELINGTFQPKKEMSMIAHQVGWAEQSPEDWWHYTRLGIQEVLAGSTIDRKLIKAIGISYQMHGLVLVDEKQEALRPSIIWCDSRAVEIGNKAFTEIGEEYCLSRYLNSPGNFTASKLKWVKDHEAKLFEKIHRIMLPGDYICMKLTGEINTSYTGLSEGIMWDFEQGAIASKLLEHYEIPEHFIPDTKPSFSEFGKIRKDLAHEFGLDDNLLITYKAGDQPNNALSLNVLHPGEVAATAGTSGVVYGISEKLAYDPKSRVNTFAHVNHTSALNRLGILLCINGTGILNNWLQKQLIGSSYEEMNEAGMAIDPGADGMMVFPFGNGAERILENKYIGAQIAALDFNRHTKDHMIRAAHEGIAFSFVYGMKIMRTLGIEPQKIKAGMGNMFLSPIFREALSTLAGVEIELYNTDGAQGAARGAGIGCGIYSDASDAFASLKKVELVQPRVSIEGQYRSAYLRWENHLIGLMDINT